jgi:hypothetical protein
MNLKNRDTSPNYAVSGHVTYKPSQSRETVPLKAELGTPARLATTASQHRGGAEGPK